MSFANLKKQSRLGSLTEKLVKEVEKTNGGSGGADERFWKPEMGKGELVVLLFASSLLPKVKISLG